MALETCTTWIPCIGCPCPTVVRQKSKKYLWMPNWFLGGFPGRALAHFTPYWWIPMTFSLLLIMPTKHTCEGSALHGHLSTRLFLLWPKILGPYKCWRHIYLPRYRYPYIICMISTRNHQHLRRGGFFDPKEWINLTGSMQWFRMKCQCTHTRAYSLICPTHDSHKNVPYIHTHWCLNILAWHRHTSKHTDEWCAGKWL